jgi:integrase
MVSLFQSEGFFRVKYAIIIDGQKIYKYKKRKLLHMAEALEAAAKELESAAIHGLPHKEKMDHWINLALITPSEAEEMFVRYEAPTDLKALNEDAWSIIMQAALREKEAEQTRRDRGGASSADYKAFRSRAKHVVYWLRQNRSTLSDIDEADAKLYWEYCLSDDCVRVEELAKVEKDPSYEPKTGSYAAKTAYSNVGVLFKYIDEAVKLGYCEHNDERRGGVRAFKIAKKNYATTNLRHPLKPDQAKWFLEMSRSEAHGHLMRGSFHVSICLGLYCGLRNTEAIWLQWKHLDLEAKVPMLHIVKSECGHTKRSHTPKTHEDRRLPLGPYLAKVLKEERARQQAAELYSPFVLLSGSSLAHLTPDHFTAVDSRTLSDVMDKVLIREGRMEYELQQGQKRRGHMMPTYYWLRHTFATNCIRKEFAIRDVMKLMGHKNLETTEIYLKQLDLENVPIARLDEVYDL